MPHKRYLKGIPSELSVNVRYELPAVRAEALLFIKKGRERVECGLA